ncbi:MAG: hypothetical protein HRF46_13760 [Acidobacteriota bacterium]
MNDQYPALNPGAAAVTSHTAVDLFPSLTKLSTVWAIKIVGKQKLTRALRDRALSDADQNRSDEQLSFGR